MKTAGSVSGLETKLRFREVQGAIHDWRECRREHRPRRTFTIDFNVALGVMNNDEPFRGGTGQANRRMDHGSRKTERRHLDSGFREQRRKLIDDFATRNSDQNRRAFADSTLTEINIVFRKGMKGVDLQANGGFDVAIRNTGKLNGPYDNVATGSNMVAAMCATPNFRRKAASSVPHSAAGRVL